MKVPKPPTAALAKRSQLLRDVRDQRPFWVKSLPRWRRGGVGAETPSRRRRRRHSRRRRRGAASIHTRHRSSTQCTKYLDEPSTNATQVEDEDVPRRARGFVVGEARCAWSSRRASGTSCPSTSTSLESPHGVAQPARRAPPRGRGRGRRGPLLAGRDLLVIYL